MLTLRTQAMLARLMITVMTIASACFILRCEGRLGQLALNTYDQALTSICFVREAATKFEVLRGQYALAELARQTGDRAHGASFDAAAAMAEFDDIADELDSVTERAAHGAARDTTFLLRRKVLQLKAQAADVPGSLTRLTETAAAFNSVVEQFAQEGFDFRIEEEALIAVTIRSTWVALVAISLAGLAVAVTLNRMIVPGVRQATFAASAIAEGRLDEDIPQKRGRRNEIAILLRALARMQSAIKQQLADIQALHAAADATQRAVVNGLAEGLQRLAMGDLTFRLQHDFGPEYEQLKTDFNDAANQLQQMIRGIAYNAAALNAGTNQIAQAADELSQRSERQAASLQQTTEAMDGIAARVRRTAEDAQHASQIVSRTKADAEQSEAVVVRAAQAMATIEQSSQQITQIIQVINDIASQTRLLALNAGMEASRAGQGGRSFAVVASEVRALAQRSAQAAKQAKTLISTSNERVSEGVTMVAHAAAALRRIMGQVGDVNTVVGEIAASNHEQSVSLQEVHASILLMDQVTQENAAMVEESTAATHSLAYETDDLLDLTTRFRVTEDADDPADASGRRHGSDLELF